jgi:hypothetical protein
LAVVCSLIFIVRASALGAGNATKHHNNARQPARGKWPTARRRHGHRFTGPNDVTVVAVNWQGTSTTV